MNESIYLSLAEFVRKNVWESVFTFTNHPSCVASCVAFRAWHSSANHTTWRSLIVVRHVVQNSVEHSVSQLIKEIND
jgi:hypothetical protein